MYYYDIRWGNTTAVLLNTVDENKKLFTPRMLNRADKARRLYGMIGRPSERDYKTILNSNELKNTSVTAKDASIALKVYGPAPASLMLNVTRKMTAHVVTDIVSVPREILQVYKNITLCADILFIGKITCFSSISRKVLFTTTNSIKNRKKVETILPCIKHIRNMYKVRGFKVTHLVTDTEFNVLRNQLMGMGIILNVTSADEHVPEIERNNRYLKEKVRGTVNSLPFKIMPRILMKAIIIDSTKWMNMFPRKAGIPNCSPRFLMTGLSTDVKIHCRVPIGSYCHIHDEPDPSNTNTPRTTGAIALHAQGNVQGGYNFLNLDTWKVLQRRSWTELPTPSHVIRQVEDKARKELKLSDDDELPDQTEFRRKDKSVIADDPINPEYQDEGSDSDGDEDDNNVTQAPPQAQEAPTTIPPPAQVPQDADAGAADAGAPKSEPDGNRDPLPCPLVKEEDIEDFDDDIDEQELDQEDLDDQEDHDDEDHNDQELHDDDDVGNDMPSMHRQEDEDNDSDSDSEDESDDESDDESQDHKEASVNEEEDTSSEEDSPKKVPVPVHHHNLRRNPKRSYKYKYGTNATMLGEMEESVYKPNDQFSSKYGHAFHILMTQMSATRGMKLFGERAENAIVEEFKQLVHTENVFEPKMFNSLTPKQRHLALRAITLIKEKRDGKVKGRTVADGSTQRDYIPPEQATSPTVSIEALLLTCVIDAMEERAVAVADVSGAFLKTEMPEDDEDVTVVFEGKMVELLIKTDASYEKYVHINNAGKKVLYVRLKKAMYGCLKAARLFYDNLAGQLEIMGFTRNRYDLCVANKVIDHKQCTVTWHVDDLKISHVNPKVVDKVIKQLESRYGKLSVTRGRKQTYVGMELNYCTDKSVEVSMRPYLIEAIAEFEEMGENIDTSKPTPAAAYLFNVDEDSPLLNDKVAKRFHKIVAKLLFVCCRGRPDINVTISFLTTRVSKSNDGDWKKLKRLLQYVHGTMDLVLKLSGDGMSIIKWWIDASYGVHDNMRSHTGTTMSLGRGSVYSRSTKQKLNTKSSTEAELVGASDGASQILWTSYFLQDQGADCKESRLHQDNQSAELLEKNGRMSSSQRTRHINIRYFFLKDRIDKNEISVVHCPTEYMIADFFTKPLQGAKFIEFRDIIMGQKLNEYPTQERVGT